MKKSLMSPAVLVLATGVLVGCAKDVPSCGDVEATKLVSQILADNVTKDTGVLQDEFKQRVHFEIEQPVVVTHNEKIASYSCKATATYKVPSVVVERLQKSTTDKDYGKNLWQNWRKMMGLYGLDDISELAQTISDDATSESAKQAAREELAEVLGVDKNLDDQKLIAMVMAYPLAQRNKEINESANLLQAVLKSADEKTQKVSIDVKYTISKIDKKGEKQFQVEAEVASDHSDMIDGIQNLEVLQSAALMTDKATVQPAKAQAQAAAPVQPTTAAEVKPAETPVPNKPEAAPAAQVASETKSQAVAEPEAKATVIEASFNCAKASAKIEKLICSTPETANADKRLAAAYSVAKTKVADEKVLKAEQLNWMKEQRNVCSDAGCLVKVTEERIVKLSSM